MNIGIMDSPVDDVRVDALLSTDTYNEPGGEGGPCQSNDINDAEMPEGWQQGCQHHDSSPDNGPGSVHMRKDWRKYPTLFMS
jgi:hypothetical protein